MLNFQELDKFLIGGICNWYWVDMTLVSPLKPASITICKIIPHRKKKKGAEGEFRRPYGEVLPGVHDFIQILQSVCLLLIREKRMPQP
jgi:hypothetical protein